MKYTEIDEQTKTPIRILDFCPEFVRGVGGMAKVWPLLRRPDLTRKFKAGDEKSFDFYGGESTTPVVRVTSGSIFG